MTTPLQLPGFPFRKTKLANGLDVIVRRQERFPLVAVNLWYHVGSKNEERRKRGYAHLFEHLMFEGSEHYPGDFFKPLQRLGAAVNGSTSSDRTNYFVDIPSAHVELALAMESDRMAHLVPALDDHKIRVQKDVVKNEYRQNYANRPYGMVWRLIAEALYPPDHPYSWLTIGEMEDVEAATREDVEAFFRRYYVPGNASLCIVGDVDEDDALALAERYFGPVPGGAKAGPLHPSNPPLADSVELRLHDRVELARLYLTWPSARLFHDDDASLTLLADVLTRGRSSRLYRDLVVGREIAQDVSAHQSGRELAGSFGVQVTLRPGRDPEQARERVDAEIADIAARGVDPAELERVRNGRLAGFFHALESIGGFGGVADRLNAYNTYLGDPGRITTDFQRYLDVTPDSIQDAARTYLDGRHRVALVVDGRKPAAPATPLDRKTPPASRAARSFRAPTPTVLNLRCGVPLWVIPARDLPVISGTLVLDGGAGVQDGDAPGLASLTSSMMDEGTTTRTSTRIAEEAESLGITLSTSCGWDGSYVGFHCLTPHLQATLDLAVDLARNPTFPEPEWSRIKGQTLASLRSERDSAEARAHRGLLAALYPPGHPYRVPIDGTEASVAAFTREHAAEFHRLHHGPHGAAWVVAGDVDAEALASALDQRLEGWDGPRNPRPELARPPLEARPKILILDRPGSVQAAVRVGHAGIARLDPDFTDTLVLNHILGGQFTSRLNSKLREEKGYTYGIRSHFDARRGAGPFSISAALQADRLADAFEDLRREFEALRADRPPTQAELDDARRSLIEGQARHFETPSSLVSRYAGLFLHGLPIDHHAHLAERLEAVTVDTLRESALRQIRPDSLIAVVVADAAAVADSLKRIEWADVAVVTE
ncbi:MAG: pitrilysin family protein [Isosphaeraceae bacterium]